MTKIKSNFPQFNEPDLCQVCRGLKNNPVDMGLVPTEIRTGKLKVCYCQKTRN